MASLRAASRPLFLLVPDLVGPGLLPCCDSITAVRLLASCSALRRCSHFVRSFEAVFLRTELLDDGGVESIAMSLRCFAGLRSLRISLPYQSLGHAHAGEGLAAPTAQLPFLAALAVDLRHNALGDAGLEAWARALGGMVQLRAVSLDFGMNDVGPAGASALASAWRAAAACGVQQLEDLVLKLNLNPIGSDGATAILCAVVSLPGLRQLRVDLDDCRIGDVGATKMASALAAELTSRPNMPLSRLSLDLSGNGSRGGGCFSSGAKKELMATAAHLGRRLDRCCCQIKV